MGWKQEIELFFDKVSNAVGRESFSETCSDYLQNTKVCNEKTSEEVKDIFSIELGKMKGLYANGKNTIRKACLERLKEKGYVDCSVLLTEDTAQETHKDQEAADVTGVKKRNTLSVDLKCKGHVRKECNPNSEDFVDCGMALYHECMKDRNKNVNPDNLSINLKCKSYTHQECVSSSDEVFGDCMMAIYHECVNQSNQAEL